MNKHLKTGLWLLKTAFYVVRNETEPLATALMVRILYEPPYDGYVFRFPRPSVVTARERKRSLTMLRNNNLAVPTSFTCDSCGLMPKCTLAFEPYNTDGDCLLDK